MIHVEISFGTGANHSKSDSEDVAETYVASLFHAGQLCGEYFLTWINGALICSAMMAGLNVQLPRHHSKWGKEALRKVVKHFSQKPAWTVRDDDIPQRNVSWKAPSLYLFTHAFDWGPPVCRGDNGSPIPTYLLPLQDQEKEDVYRWQESYVLHDRMWLDSGTLEIPAYKQLALPNSELSEAGREICAKVEKSTGVSTYYFLLRYYARDLEGDARLCPNCGGKWQASQAPDAPFYKWRFRCDPCRLASVAGVELDRRLSRVGVSRAKARSNYRVRGNL